MLQYARAFVASCRTTTSVGSFRKSVVTSPDAVEPRENDHELARSLKHVYPLAPLHCRSRNRTSSAEGCVENSRSILIFMEGSPHVCELEIDSELGPLNARVSACLH